MDGYKHHNFEAQPINPVPKMDSYRGVNRLSLSQWKPPGDEFYNQHSIFDLGPESKLPELRIGRYQIESEVKRSAKHAKKVQLKTLRDLKNFEIKNIDKS